MRASLILLSCLVGFTLQRAPKCAVGTRPACKDERKKVQPPCPEGHPKACADGREPSFPGLFHTSFPILYPGEIQTFILISFQLQDPSHPTLPVHPLTPIGR